MRLERLKLHNWWSIADLDLHFDGDVIGIVGPNGCGKSTLVAAIRYLLLGETVKQKPRNVRWGADSGFVEGTFSHGDRHFTVNRDILSSRCWMQYEGQAKLKRKDDVDQEIIRLLGVSPKVFGNHVIVGQGELDQPLKMTHARLSSDFQSLFGTEHCEVIRELLKSRYDALVVYDPAGSEEELKTRLHATEGKIKDLQSRAGVTDLALAGGPKWVRGDRQYTHLEVQGEWTASIQRQTQMESLEREWVADSAAAADLDQRINELQPRLQQTEAAEASSRPGAEAAKARLAGDGARVMARQHQQTLAARLQQVTTQLAEETSQLAAVPDENPLRTLIDNLSREEVEKRGRIGALTTSVNALRAEMAVCPVCQQSVPDAPQRVAHFSAEIQSLNAALAPLTIKLVNDRRELESAIARKADLQRRVSADQAERQRLETQLAAMKPEDMQSMDDAQRQACNELVAAWEAVRNRIVQMRQQMAGLQSHGQTVGMSLHRRETERATLQQAGVSLFTRQEYDEAVHWQGEEARLKVQAAGIEGELRTLQQTEETDRKSLELLRERVARSTKTREFKDLLERTRSLLHRDNVPRLVAHAYLASMNGTLGRILVDLGFPFTVCLQDDLSFAFSSQAVPDQKVLSDDLSGGQQILFCIAFRLAVNEQFASELGFLVLDEPTPYVDSDNVAAIADVFENLRGYVRAAGVQIILVTHERALIPACDAVIDVQAARMKAEATHEQPEPVKV